ncbi:MAG TPA: hypothetical protein V6C85_36110 [Allocoleopsis sp.]
MHYSTLNEILREPDTFLFFLRIPLHDSVSDRDRIYLSADRC